MNTYIFETSATMKEYNRSNWWIDSDIIRRKTIPAENLKSAFDLYIKYARETVEISNNAIKNKKKMYIDDINGQPKQTGFVITAKTLFDKDDYSGYTEQYIDLWVEIITVTETNFTEV